MVSGATSADIRSNATEDGSLFNQAVVFDGGGAVVDVYRKTHLVPYGEYIPWKPIVGWISALDQIAYELTPGERLHTLTAPGLPRVRARRSASRTASPRWTASSSGRARSSSWS